MGQSDRQAVTMGKYSLILLLFVLALPFCQGKSGNAFLRSPFPGGAEQTVILHPAQKLLITGDFDGDGKQDTVIQHTWSGRTGTALEQVADPLKNDWDVVVQWFYTREAEQVLSMAHSSVDSLRLGVAQGLYCLLNIGDSNGDGKDEIALVVDYLDQSRVNSCKVYSLCGNSWTQLKQFGIREEAFDYTGEKAPVFDQIKDYLEKRNGNWVYKDYSHIGYDRPEDVECMLPLLIDPCK